MKAAKTTWIIRIASDLAVIGYNPENADFDRPRGEIIAEVFYLRAVNGRGDAREFGRFDSAAIAEDAILLAPAVDLWAAGRPEYGSRAYEAYGAADDIESERRLDEAQAWGFDTRYGRY